MKKLFIIFFNVFLFSSCSSDDNSTDSGLYKWSFKLDGVLYEWSGDISDAFNGYSVYSNSEKSLIFSKNIDLYNSVYVSIYLPENGLGNYSLNNSDSFFINISPDISQSINYSISSVGTMNVLITSISNSSIEGKVKGTFSGTIRKIGGEISTVTEGSFEAMKSD